MGDSEAAAPPLPQQICRSCGATILWVVTMRGRPMPLDAEPVADGTVWIENGHVMLGTPPDGVIRWRSHFATCPQADRWRKK